MADTAEVTIVRHAMDGPRQMNVYVQAKAIQPLQGSKVTNMAMDYARQNGFSAAGVIAGGDQPYPIDASGQVLVDMSAPFVGYEREVKIGS